jgi:hypothetical protein
MYAIDLIDRSFHKDSSGTYELSIQANQNGLVYCIFDKKTGQYVLFRKHSFEHVQFAQNLTGQITEVLEKDETLDLPFHFVKFLGYTQQSTLVPATFYNRDKMMDYLSFNHSGEIDQELYSNHITPPGLYNVFALPRDLVSMITMHFKKVEFLNQTTPFLKHIALDQDAFSKPAVHIGLNSGFLDLACVGDGKLKLYNTFQYVNESDLLYYVLYVYRQFGLDTQKIPLYISGELSSKLSYYESLKQYVPETKNAVIQGIPALAPGLHQLNTVKFLNLLNLQTCVLSAEHTGAEK